VQLFTLISMHALVLLTFATVVLELLVAHEDAAPARRTAPHAADRAAGGEERASFTRCRCPSSPGLLYAQTGWGLHPVVDRPLQCWATPSARWRWCWWA
jgi:malonate transporter